MSQPKNTQPTLIDLFGIPRLEWSKDLSLFPLSGAFVYATDCWENELDELLHLEFATFLYWGGTRDVHLVLIRYKEQPLVVYGEAGRGDEHTILWVLNEVLYFNVCSEISKQALKSRTSRGEKSCNVVEPYFCPGSDESFRFYGYSWERLVDEAKKRYG